jgi:ribosomal-protein-alanine N-acetyltransferase
MIQFRPAAKADISGLYRLDQICFPAGIAYSLREFRALLHSPRTIAILAEEDSRLCAFVIALSVRSRDNTGGHIITIDVDPDFRRRGIGRLLMEHIESELRAAGAERLCLEVATNNPEAQNFYSHLGFVPIGRIEGYYDAGLDAIVMEKSLSG